MTIRGCPQNHFTDVLVFDLSINSDSLITRIIFSNALGEKAEMRNWAGFAIL